MKYIILLCFIISIFGNGCAGIEPPSPGRLIPPWDGASPLHLGDSKDFVLDKWGEPDEIIQIGVDDVGLIQEEWIYDGTYPVLEIESKILTRGESLIFTGNALTGYKPKE
jgi:hypothetical protein